jgi:signal transduction histidine kinase
MHRALRARWRRLPLAAQLAAVVISVSLGWAVLARTLTQRQDLRVAEVATALARLDVASDGSLRMLEVVIDRRAAARDPRGRWPTSDATDPVEAVAADLAAVLASHPRPARAMGDWLVRYRDWRRIAATGADDRDAFTELLVQHVRLRRAIAQRVNEIRDEAAVQEALDRREQVLLRAAILAIVLLLVIVVTRTVRTTLADVVRSAEALAQGRYAAATLPTGIDAPSSELQRLATVFTNLSRAVAAREGSLQDEVQSLREIEQIKTEFVATVSHELRTPLTSIRGALGLLVGGSTGPMPTKALPLLKIALSNTERLIRLINDILALEKADGAGEDAVADLVRVDDVVIRSVASLELLARERQIAVRLDTQSRAAILGTEDRLMQAVTNLVANAIKFSPDGGTVHVTTTTTGERVRVSVHDQGPGIPEEFRTRIFGRFQQAHGTVGGTGLGLAITKRIVERLGGTIGYECPETGGTSFTLTLPAAEVRDVAPFAPVADGGPTILIIDPDASIREVLGALLSPSVAVVGVASLAEASERLREPGVVAIIIEPALEAGEGVEFILRLRARDAYHDLPIVLFTADDALANHAARMDVAASRIYRKSIDPEPQVARRVRAMLAARGIG